MSRPRIVALVALASLALCGAISGCSATVAAPTGPTDDEVSALVRAELDKQWGFTGLEGVLPRPVIEVEKIGTAGGAAQGFWDCMSAKGFESWGFSGDTGLQLYAADSTQETPTPEQQLSYYECNARFPLIDTLTTSQLNFIYDYYQRWLIPCLEHAGYSVMTPPTREAFTTEVAEFGWRWQPYSAIVSRGELGSGSAINGSVINANQYAALEARCKPTIPGLEGWSLERTLF